MTHSCICTRALFSLALLTFAFSGCRNSTGGTGGTDGAAAEGGAVDGGGSVAGTGGSTGGTGGGSVAIGGTTGTTPGSTGATSSMGGVGAGGSTHSDGGSTATGGKGTGGASVGGDGTIGSGGAGGIVLTGGASGSNGGVPGGVGGDRAGGTTGNANGGRGGAAVDGGGGYRPCPTNGDACRILPLGDSITFGFTFSGDTFTGGYRVKLFANAVAANQKVTFTGSQTNGPDTVSGVTFPKRHEGHGGWRIAQITPLIPSPAFDATSGGVPHIVLLHIGSNDTCCTGVPTMLSNLGTLIDSISSAAPDALIVVAQIIPLAAPGYDPTVRAYNAGIPDVIKARSTAGKHVMMVDMYTDFPITDLEPDLGHPTPAGYELMADRWYGAIGDLLPK